MVWQNFSKKSLVTISCSPLRTSLVSSATLLCKTNILTMSMLVLSMGMSTNNFRFAQQIFSVRQPTPPVLKVQYQDG